MKRCNLVFVSIVFLLISIAVSADDYGWERTLGNDLLAGSDGGITAMVVFNGNLYAGTENSNGGHVWRTPDGTAWEDVTPNGGVFPNGTYEVNHMFVFDGRIYVEYNLSSGSELWRSLDGGTWNSVSDGIFNDINCSATFNNQIYVGTDYNGDVWRSPDGTSWTRVASFTGMGVYSLMVFNNIIYAGTDNRSGAGGEIWRSSDGTSWELSNTPGFGSSENDSISCLAVFNGYLYAGTENIFGTGAEIWRSADGVTWERVEYNGLGYRNNKAINSLAVFNGSLFSGVENSSDGAQIWRTSDGLIWKRCSDFGLGNDINEEVHALLPAGHDVLVAGTDYFADNDNITGEIYWHDALTPWDSTSWTGVNIAPRAVYITASSEYSSNYRVNKAIDNSYGIWDAGEWASSGEMNPWMELGWDRTVAVNKIVLYDRPNKYDQIMSGELVFSDGSSIRFGMLPYGGSAKEIVFPRKDIQWLRLNVLDGVGLNVGLAEIEVFNMPQDQLTNISSTVRDVYASSEYNDNYSVGKSVDGSYGIWDGGEWASRGEMDPWIVYDWYIYDSDRNVYMAYPLPPINRIRLYDRPNKYDQILTGTVTLYTLDWLQSDAEPIVYNFGMLPYGGSGKDIVFPTVENVISIDIDVIQGTGYNVGLSEIQIFEPDTMYRTLVTPETVTPSSEYSSAYTAAKAIDGSYGIWDGGEWASAGEMTPWILFSWNSPRMINKIILHDRPNRYDQIMSGRLEFSDGSSIRFGMLPYGGSGKDIAFPVKTVTWVRLVVEEGTGLNVGLSEFRAIYDRELN